MSFDLWLHIVEALMVLGIVLVVAYVKMNQKNKDRHDG